MNFSIKIFLCFFICSNFIYAASLERSVFIIPKSEKNKNEHKKPMFINNCGDSDLSINIIIEEEVIDRDGKPIKLFAEHTIPVLKGQSREIYMDNERLVNQSFSKKITLNVMAKALSSSGDNQDMSGHILELVTSTYNSVTKTILKSLYEHVITFDKDSIKHNLIVNIFKGMGGYNIIHEFQMDQDILKKRFDDRIDSVYHGENIKKFFKHLYILLKDGACSELNKKLQSKNLPLFLVTKAEIDDFFVKVERGLTYYSECLDNEIYNRISKVYALEDLLAHKRDLVWFLYSIAIFKNQYFNEGMIIIEDLDYRVYKFLTWNNNGRFDHIKPKPSYFTPHFSNLIDRAKEESCNKDIDFSQSYIEISGLPLKFPHILFGKLGFDRLFIKLLDYSYYNGIAVLKLFKSISVDDFHRKEHVSGKLVGEYIQEIQNLNIQNFEEFKNKASFFGINYMISSLIFLFDGCYDSLLSLIKEDFSKVDKKLPIYCEELINKFKESSKNIKQDNVLLPNQKKAAYFIINLLYRYDNLNLRIGNEVIISSSELKHLIS